MSEIDQLRHALNELEAEIATLIARRAALPEYPGDNVDYLRGRVLEMRARRNALSANVENRLAAIVAVGPEITATEVLSRPTPGDSEPHEKPARAE